MVLGFNHNVQYKGEVFHVQTEDSGVANPHIITLLYKGGVILCSRKTSYADILKMENLEQVVEELMKEQHKDMMRRLKTGEFDERASSIPASPMDTPDIQPPVADPLDDLSIVHPAQQATPSGTDSFLPSGPSVGQADAAQKRQTVNADIEPKNPGSLEDAILAFFGANEK